MNEQFVFKCFFILTMYTPLHNAFVDQNVKPKLATHNNQYIRGCYYTNWAQYRQDKAKYVPENYFPGLCTHIFYAFATINQDLTMKPFEWNDESAPGTKGMFERINELKKLQPDLKTLLSFGGWTFSEQNKPLLKRMASNAENRKTFIDSALTYIKKHEFDGFDLDWEYPDAEDKTNFATLLKEMGVTFHKEGYLLTAAVAAAVNKIDDGYDVPTVALSLDMVNIMTYDIHGSWEKVTGFNSPLYDRFGDQLSVSTAVEHWVRKGIPKNKIVVGFASYGRAWTLTEAAQTDVGAAGSIALAGQYTKEAGFLAYYEICDMLSNGGKRYFDHIQKVPYLVKGNQWVGYDDLESYKIKLDWLKKAGYGGAFVWTLDLDDFDGQCASHGGQKYPLISFISKELGGTGGNFIPTYSTGSSSSTAAPSPQPAKWTTTVAVSSGSGSSFSCPGIGLFADPNSCLNFYSCDVHGDAHKMVCGSGLNFNPKTKVCDWPYNSECKSAARRQRR